MSSLSGAWLVVSLLQLAAWIGACVLGAGVGGLSRRTRASLDRWHWRPSRRSRAALR